MRRQVDTYVLLLRSLLHGDLLGVVQPRQDAQRLFVVAPLTQVSRHLDLLLHLLNVVHDVDRKNALSLNRLTVGAIGG